MAIVYLLARSITGSTLLGLVAAALTISMQPRLYAYPKVLLFPLCLWLLWRYIDRPQTPQLVALAVTTAIAFLFRYDYGVEIAVTIGAILIATHGRAAARPVLTYVLVGTVVSGPYLVWLGMQRQLWSTGSSGLLSMAESAPRITLIPVHVDFSHGLARVTPRPPQLSIRWSRGTDAEIRRQVEQRSGLQERDRKDSRTTEYFIDDPSPAHIRSLLADRNVEDTGGVDRHTGELLSSTLWNRTLAAIPLLRVTPAPIFPTPRDASGWIYYVFLLSPLMAVVALWLLRTRAPDALKVMSLAVLCLLLHQFMIRGSLDSRLPDVAGPTAVLLAWLARVSFEVSRRLSGAWAKTGRVAITVSMALLVVLMWASVTTYAGTSWVDVVTAGASRPGVFADVTNRLSRRPIDYWTDKDSVGTRAATRYVAECLSPDDRLLLVTYAPEVFYVAERLFAGGINFFHAGAFSSPPEQATIVARLQRQSVPVVIVEDSEVAAFKENYSDVESYVASRYREAAVLGFGDSKRRFHVLVDKERNPVGTDSRWSLPCFQAGSG